MAREITYLTDVFLITCVVESGIADKIIDAANNISAAIIKLQAFENRFL